MESLPDLVRDSQCLNYYLASHLIHPIKNSKKFQYHSWDLMQLHCMMSTSQKQEKYETWMYYLPYSMKMSEIFQMTQN